MATDAELRMRCIEAAECVAHTLRDLLIAAASIEHYVVNGVEDEDLDLDDMRPGGSA